MINLRNILLFCTTLCLLGCEEPAEAFKRDTTIKDEQILFQLYRCSLFKAKTTVDTPVVGLVCCGSTDWCDIKIIETKSL